MSDLERLVTNLRAPWSIDWAKADELDHTYIDILIDRGVLVPVEPDGCQCEACTRKHKSDCNVHSGELQTHHGCTCGAWPSNLSECDAPFECSFCGGER